MQVRDRIYAVGRDAIFASIDELYGPYSSIDNAKNELNDLLKSLNAQENEFPVGLTIGILSEDNVLTEYYWNGSTFKIKTNSNANDGITGGNLSIYVVEDTLVIEQIV